MTSSQVKHQVTHSYSATLKSTSIIGGSQAISYVIALVKTKLVAVLLGADGLGMVHLFLSTTTLIQQITGLGIGQSGVREIAKSHGSELDEQSIGQTVCVLRRACWFTGTLGWVCMACFSLPLSRWAFGTQKYAGLIAILGVTLLLTAVSSGQRAVIQGTRRIRDFAQMGVISSLANACFAIVIYAMIGERGIVPVLIATAVINVAVSWWFARRISVAPAHGLSWVQTIWKSKQLAQLGVAFMWGGSSCRLGELWNTSTDHVRNWRRWKRYISSCLGTFRHVCGIRLVGYGHRLLSSTNRYFGRPSSS